MTRYASGPPAEFRAKLRALRRGDVVRTGTVDPWTPDVGEQREETVTSRGRLIITTTHGRYWFTGRSVGLHGPLSYAREIYRIETTP